jgi:hypothetical protein
VPQYLATLRGTTNGNGNGHAAREQREQYQAELLSLTLAERRRELLPRVQVVSEGQAFVKALQAKVRTLPRRLVLAELIAHDAEPAVTALVHEALDEIARWSSILDLHDATRRPS